MTCPLSPPPRLLSQVLITPCHFPLVYIEYGNCELELLLFPPVGPTSLDIMYNATHFSQNISLKRHTTLKVLETPISICDGKNDCCFHHLKAINNKGETFISTVISKTWPRIISSKRVFLESVTFQLRHRMFSTFLSQSLKSYGHFSDLSLSVTAMLENVDFFQLKRKKQSTASERTSRLGNI